MSQPTAKTTDRRSIKAVLQDTHSHYGELSDKLGELSNLIGDGDEPDVLALKNRIEDHIGPMDRDDIDRDTARAILEPYSDNGIGSDAVGTAMECIELQQTILDEARTLANKLDAIGLADPHTIDVVDSLEQVIGIKPADEDITDKTLNAFLDFYR